MKLSECEPRLKARILAQLADDFRPVSSTFSKSHHERKAPRPNPPQARRESRLVVSLIALRRRPLDPDNNAGSFKHLQDAIAASLGLDDGDKRLTWQYQQLHTFGREGVLVHIESL